MLVRAQFAPTALAAAFRREVATLDAELANWLGPITLSSRLAGRHCRDVIALMVKERLRPLGVGLALGLTASSALNGLLTSMLVRVSPTDPISFAAAASVLRIAAALGCAVRAGRALCVDPVVALRND